LPPDPDADPPPGPVVVGVCVQSHGTVRVTSILVDFGWHTEHTVVVTVKPGGSAPQEGVGPTHVSVIVVVTGIRPVEQMVVYTVV
jgi:hypothetical protein